LTAKGRSQSDWNKGHEKFGQLQGQFVGLHSRYQHCKNTLEQRHQQQEGKIHVPGYNFFYLMAALKYFKYMKIPLALFPSWIVKQYGLAKHQKD
jgi:hypothetical protein